MIRWEKEAVHAPIIARYSLGLISLGKLARGFKVTTLEAMQLLRNAGYTSTYSFEEYVEAQKLLYRLYQESDEDAGTAQVKPGRRSRSSS